MTNPAGNGECIEARPVSKRGRPQSWRGAIAGEGCPVWRDEGDSRRKKREEKLQMQENSPSGGAKMSDFNLCPCYHWASKDSRHFFLAITVIDL